MRTEEQDRGAVVAAAAVALTAAALLAPALGEWGRAGGGAARPAPTASRAGRRHERLPRGAGLPPGGGLAGHAGPRGAVRHRVGPGPRGARSADRPGAGRQPAPDGAVLVAAALVAVSAGAAAVDRSRLSQRGEGFAELSALCGRGDLVAIPSHMAAGGLGEYPDDDVRLWPVRDQPYLERFRLDDRPEVIAQAPAHVTVCDVRSVDNAEDVARFERDLRAAGYRLQRDEQVSEVFVRSYRRA